MKHPRLSMIALSLLPALLPVGCDRVYIEPEVTGHELFYVRKTDGKAMMGEILEQPELFLLSEHLAVDRYYNISVSFTGSDIVQGYTERLRSGDFLQIPVPLSCFINESKSTDVSVTVRSSGSDDIIFRNYCHLAIKDIQPQVEWISFTSGAHTSTIENNQSVTLHQGESGSMRIKCNYPEALQHIDYSLLSGSYGVRLSGTCRSSVITEDDQTFVELKYSALGKSGSGVISFHLSGNESSTLFRVKYSVVAEGSDPQEDDPSLTDLGAYTISVAQPQAVFAERGFHLNVSFYDYTSSDIFNASVKIDGENVPIGEKEDDFYNFEYTIRDVSPSKILKLYVTGHSVSPGRHNAVVYVWPSDRARDAGKQYEFAFVAQNFRVDWLSMATGFNVFPAGEEALDIPVVLSSSEKDFFIEAGPSEDASKIADISASSTSSRLSLTKISTRPWRWKTSGLSRGRNKISYNLKTSEGVVYTWDSCPYFYEKYTTTLSVSGDKLYAETSGPINTPDFTLAETLWADLYAVIPYTEAVVESGEYITKEKFEYTYLSTLEKEILYPKGISFTKKEIYLGLSSAINIANGQLAVYKAEKNGATRWINTGGIYQKETYTPTPYILAKAGTDWSASDGRDLEFLELEVVTRNIESYLNNKIQVSWCQPIRTQ